MPEQNEIDGLIESMEQMLAHAEAVRLSLRRAQQELSADMAVMREELDRLRFKPADQGRDRRTSPRMRYEHTCVCVADSAHQNVDHVGWVIDFSEGGVCLIVDHDFSGKKELLIRPMEADPSFRWVKVHVRYCRREADQWKLGCEFAEHQSDSNLRAFGSA